MWTTERYEQLWNGRAGQSVGKDSSNGSCRLQRSGDRQRIGPTNFAEWRRPQHDISARDRVQRRQPDDQRLRTGLERYAPVINIAAATA